MKKLFQEQETAARKKNVFSSDKLQRRLFLQYTGAGIAGLALIASGCEKSDSLHPEILMQSPGGGVSFGSGDIGILNYAYALEQLEAAFYTQVADTPYSGISARETSILTDIRDHEIGHREFFKTALGSNAIGALEVNFSTIDFSSRESVLSTAKAFEDLGVSAYNGAGRLIKAIDYLTLAGKIVSVEARHAASIRDLIEYNSFADKSVVNGQGLDTSRSPSQVLAIAKPYIKTEINTEGLPNY